MTYELYIGVDLHKAFFQVCALAGDGRRVWEDRYRRTPEEMAAFAARCGRHVAMAVEASTPTFAFVDALERELDRIVIVDPYKTKLKAGYAAKTDRLDARRLADALRRESVVGIYQPPRLVRELRELCRSRQTLVRTYRAVDNRAGAVLLRQGIADLPAPLETPAALRWLATQPLSAEAHASLQRLHAILVVTARELAAVDRLVVARATDDPIVGALDPIMGIGPRLGLTIRAEVGDIARFPSGGHLASYAGLVPRVDASASRIRYGRITKRGAPLLRWALIEAAMHAPKRRDAEGRWTRQLAIRKGALKARVAAARRLCDEIVARWPR